MAGRGDSLVHGPAAPIAAFFLERVEGAPRKLPLGVDLSGYRLVQEALTNTLKHARARRACGLVRPGDG